MKPRKWQVFWLPDHTTALAFPFVAKQWLFGASFPVTAAGPRRIYTVFPFQLQADFVGATIRDSKSQSRLSFSRSSSFCITSFQTSVTFPRQISMNCLAEKASHGQEEARPTTFG